MAGAASRLSSMGHMMMRLHLRAVGQSSTMRSVHVHHQDLAQVMARIEHLLDKRSGLSGGLAEKDTADLVKLAQKWQDPLGGEQTAPIMPGDRAFYGPGDYDCLANALLNGARPEEGGGRGVAVRVKGNGACLMNAVAAGAFGARCRSARQALSFALPLRAAAVRTALLNMETFVTGETYGSDYQSLDMYDANILDRISIVGQEVAGNTPTQVAPRLTVGGSEEPGAGGVRDGFHLPSDVARLCFILNILSICPEFSTCQQATFPLLAETLKMDIRCFHPGASIQPILGGRWSRRMFFPLFRPEGGQGSRVPCILLSMSLPSWRTRFETLQEFAHQCKEPPAAKNRGRATTSAERYELPEFSHFVLLLPPEDPPQKQEAEGVVRKGRGVDRVKGHRARRKARESMRRGGESPSAREVTEQIGGEARVRKQRHAQGGARLDDNEANRLAAKKSTRNLLRNGNNAQGGQRTQKRRCFDNGEKGNGTAVARDESTREDRSPEDKRRGARSAGVRPVGIHARKGAGAGGDKDKGEKGDAGEGSRGVRRSRQLRERNEGSTALRLGCQRNSSRECADHEGSTGGFTGDSDARGPDDDCERKRARRTPRCVRGGRLESQHPASRSDSSTDGDGDIGAEDPEADGSAPKANHGGGLHTCRTGGEGDAGLSLAGQSGARIHADEQEDGNVGSEDILSDDGPENRSVGSEENEPGTGSEENEDHLSADNLEEGSVGSEEALMKGDPENGNVGNEDSLSEEEAEVVGLGKPEGVFKGRRFSIVGGPEETWGRAVEDVMRALRAVGHSCIKRHDKLWDRPVAGEAGGCKRLRYVWVECRYGGKPDPRIANRGEGKAAVKSQKVGCQFRVALAWPQRDDAPRITKVHLEHNHALIGKEPEGHPTIPIAKIEQRAHDIEYWTKCNVAIPNICEMIERDPNSPEKRGNLGTRGRRKVREMVDSFRRGHSSHMNDATDFISAIKGDGLAYVEYVYDETKRLRAVFWASGIQRELALKLGDVVIQGTTSFTNRAKLLLCVFVGVDEENKSRLLAQALLPDEKTESILFAFEHFVRLREGMRPKVIITDGDLAMATALEELLPGTVHLFCLWYMLKNVVRNCSGSLSHASLQGNLMGLLGKAAFAVTEDAFIDTWEGIEALVKDTGAERYLRGTLWEHRGKWAFCHRLTVLALGMSTTQRAKGVFGVLKRVVHCSSSLLELRNAIKEMNENALYETHRLGEGKVIDINAFAHRHLEERFKPILEDLNACQTSQYVIKRIRHEFSSAMCYTATVLASARRLAEEDEGQSDDTDDDEDDDDVANLLASLRTHSPNSRAAHAPDAAELVNLESNGADGREDVCMFARPSLKAFVGVLDDARVRVRHVLRVTYNLTEDAGSHILVLGPRGFHLCSCFHVLQHGFPCRHFFAVELLIGKGRRPASFWGFDVQSVHPRWRRIVDAESENWTPGAVLGTAVAWEGRNGSRNTEQ